MDNFWYKEAIIYELHVKCFYDSSGDGIGDFNGLAQKLDYLQDLGVTAIWLLPFYPSPLKDDGYDISNYTDVHPHYGDLKDFREFLKGAHERNIRVITELVINHTSDQHPWFQKSRRREATKKERDFYVWSQQPDKYKEARIIFQDFEPSNWAWDREANAYFWHRFYSHQPDLNFDNPAVHAALLKNLSFWFKMGVDGMRLDAVPYLYEREGTNCENLPETHAFLKKLRRHMDSHFSNKMLLAEANQWPEDAAKYFGNGDECHMAFHFPVMPRLFMAIHLEDALPIIEIMEQTPTIPESCQWAMFLRNHDELTLEMVTDEERDYMYRVYAYDPQARLNLGIRRRLAPLLKNDRRKIELMKVLLFSLHGTPVIYYGDEIGMGDNIYLGDRNGVRTPMQWSSDRNAGFSKANPQQLYLPPIVDPEYHYETVNVEAQLNNPHSLLWWTRQLISLRKRYKAFSYGSTTFLPVENRKILVFFREYGSELLLIITNLSRYPQYVEVDLKKYQGYRVVEMFSGERFPLIGELPYFLTLGAYGYYWFALEKRPEVEEAILDKKRGEKPPPEIAFKQDGEKIFSEPQRRLLDALVRKYLAKQSWYLSLLPKIERTKSKISDYVQINKKPKTHLVIVEIHLISATVYRIPLFLAILEGKEAKEKLVSAPERVLAFVKNNNNKDSILFDLADAPVIEEILRDIITEQKKVKTKKGILRGVRLFPITEKSQLNIFHQLEEGMNPDIEIRLFLAKKTHFKSFFPLIGYLEFQGADKTTLALAEVLEKPKMEYNAKQAFVEAADLFFQRIASFNESQEITLPPISWIKLAFGSMDKRIQDLLEAYPMVAQTMGETTAEFHQAMLSDPLDPLFAPTGYTVFYQRALFQTMQRNINEAFIKLKKLKTYQDMHPFREKLIKYMEKFTRTSFRVERIRLHGNYILENLYFSGKEFFITNFGGNPTLSFAERKYKRSPLRDIAAMLVSIGEASFEALDKIKLRGQVPSHSIDRFEEWALLWSAYIGSTFLRAYLRKAEEHPFMLLDKKEIDFLIGIFFLEKCGEKIIQSENHINTYCVLIKHWLQIYEATEST